MLVRFSAVRLLPVAAVAALAACQDAAAPPPPAANGPITLQGAQFGAPDPDALARAIPGFGGVFLRNGVPTVYLIDLRERPALEAALGGFARAQGLAASRIEVLPGRFTWVQLQRWFARVSSDALAEDGVVFVDLDEARNRVTIGVERGASVPGARALAARLGLPDGAVGIQETEPIQLAATLRDQVRPVVGGLQINFPGFLCTLGFNAVDAGQNSFITNSHCTSTQGGVESTPYHQPLESVSGSFIGTEVEDPVYQRNITGCPRGKLCRRSDAARAAYAGGVNFTLGGIAATSGPNNGSLTITGSFSITAEGTAAVGQVVNKIGRTTGWTQGQVTNTCVNTAVSGSRIVQLCQTFVSAGVGGGDSGSNVFMQTGGSNVTLVGILWGGNSSGTTFVYSPIANIEQELGALTTH
jgi:hypothetical protein